MGGFYQTRADLDCEQFCLARRGWRTVLGAIPANDLFLKAIDDDVELLSLGRQLPLKITEINECLGDLALAQVGKTGQDPVIHDLVDEASPRRFWHWRGDFDVLEIGFITENHPPGKNLRKGFKKCSLLFTRTSGELEIEEVHPTVDQTSVIRDHALHVLGGVTALPQLGQLYRVEIGDEIGIEGPVDSAAAVTHES